MKVCQILAGSGVGGLEKHTIELSHELQKAGIDVTVIAHKDFANNLKNIRFIPLDLTKGRNNILILFKLYKILKNEQFDIIHTQANKATAMVVKLKPFLKSKIVSTIHNVKSNVFQFKKSDYVITVSDKIGEQLDIKNKKTIYNGIKLFDHNEYKINLHNKYNINKGDFIICSVARFAKVKRFDILLKALQSLQNVHLILVGSGKEKEFLKNLAIDLGIEKKVTFTGFLNIDSVRKIMASSDLFVLTSDHEGFGYTYIESLFANLPVVSTDVADIKNTIGAFNIIPFNDPISLANKIEYFKNNYEEVLENFSDIFSTAKKKFVIDNMLSETLSVYKKLLRD